jgi:adenylyl-sulfate kinase
MNPVKNGFVLWFTGLSGSGKSTLAERVAARLRGAGCPVELLDGDEVRTHISAGLGFSRADRDVNVRRIGYVARLLARNGVVAITAAISPYREVREEQRAKVTADGAGFCEVYMECPLEVLAERDVKGLYRRALAGEIDNFTGVSDPYEPPRAPEVVVRSDTDAIETGVERVLRALVELELLSPTALEAA